MSTGGGTQRIPSSRTTATTTTTTRPIHLACAISVAGDRLTIPRRSMWTAPTADGRMGSTVTLWGGVTYYLLSEGRRPWYYVEAATRP